MAAGLDVRIGELYALPLEEFTAARNALAKELASGGDKEGAARVKALAKPARAAWIVNQLVRDEADEVRALIHAGEGLRKAQRRAVSGRGADEFRERAEERRRLISSLVDHGRSYEGGPGAADQVAATLDAASADPEAAKVVLAGTLTRPLPPPTGFGDSTGLALLAGGRPNEEPAARQEPRRRDDDREAIERELTEAERHEAAAQGRVADLRRELEERQTAIADLRERIRAAEADARGASMQVRRLRSRLR
jgi:hypothetical protein